MSLQLRSANLHSLPVRTRMPFRYGIAVMENLPHVVMTVTVEVDGVEQCGWSADHLPPKWFTKNSNASPESEIEEMREVIRHAMELARGRKADSAFALWLELYREQLAWGESRSLPPLLAHFGVTLVERAVIDAVCRAKGRPFSELLRTGALGFEPGLVHPELAGSAGGDWLPQEPLSSITLRHTVGLGDYLEDAEIPAAERLDDGLPQSLSASIRFYGLRHFKIKLASADGLPRLKRMLALMSRECAGDFAFSIDGNEAWRSAETFRDFWQTHLAGDETLAPFLDRLLYVEQPFSRDVALGDEIGRTLHDWKDAPPVIIDESDAEVESLPQALELGYAGTSHKNCKGVFKGIANACLLAKRRRENPSRNLLLSGEDLCNIAPWALLQDLAVQATLGIESVERNGHHYFAGLSVFPEAIREPVLAAHTDCFVRSERGWPRLDVRDGRLKLGSVNRAPFGLTPEITVTSHFQQDYQS